MATNPPVVKRVGKQITDGMEVFLQGAVQMFDFDRNNQPRFLRFLPVGAVVKIDLKRSMQAIGLGFKFYYVKYDRFAGYVPKAAIHDYVTAMFSSAGVTGVTYGGDNWTTDGKGNLFSFPFDKDGKARCYDCGGKANHHKLYESNYVTSVLFEFIELLNRKRLSRRDGFMIGVVRTLSQDYVIAYSGSMTGSDMAAFKECAAKLPEKPLVAPVVSGTKYFYDTTRFRNYNDDMRNWSCAAPRLIQSAWKNLQSTPRMMSEKWFGPPMGKTAIEGHSIKSCDICRKYLPAMLCGVATYNTSP